MLGPVARLLKSPRCGRLLDFSLVRGDEEPRVSQRLCETYGFARRLPARRRIGRSLCKKSPCPRGRVRLGELERSGEPTLAERPWRRLLPKVRTTDAVVGEVGVDCRRGGSFGFERQRPLQRRPEALDVIAQQVSSRSLLEDLDPESGVGFQLEDAVEEGQRVLDLPPAS